MDRIFAARVFTELPTQLVRAFDAIYSGWILWNLFLAFIPLALSFWLFRRKTRSRSLLWWIVFVVFVAFLPNAPYVLTDIIHLIRGIRPGLSPWIITLFVIPVHLFAMLVGFEAYVVSLINQGYYLRRLGARQFVNLAELILHALCAVGVYLGRFRRFNSWDLVTEPGNILIKTVNDLTERRPLFVVIIIFVIITIFYWIMKQITLGLVLRIHHARAKTDIDQYL
ncbi:DUF1361 domain-containing protein [Chroococcidiopsis sp. TS-821]|uniref:DUF1361 domain-containing protein n=1 Tax=Chroococcidiopsis sp. TS-821 TaxID=1378066 RepID=UPI000D4F7154|nr:DUF1361 domain-containing protein [Chroococcidiopsis sp. TS-821]PPS45628.1 hypothetical protein B1A85_05135 [Chroococcidiopsis sp. TS-821]